MLQDLEKIEVEHIDGLTLDPILRAILRRYLNFAQIRKKELETEIYAGRYLYWDDYAKLAYVLNRLKMEQILNEDSDSKSFLLDASRWRTPDIIELLLAHDFGRNLYLNEHSPKPADRESRAALDLQRYATRSGKIRCNITWSSIHKPELEQSHDSILLPPDVEAIAKLRQVSEDASHRFITWFHITDTNVSTRSLMRGSY